MSAEDPVQTRPTVPADPSQLKAKILKQAEFYFSDANLPRDKFMQAQLAKNADGWIEVALIASFSRMKALTTDLSSVVDAIAGSESLLELNEDRTAVRRRVPTEGGSKDTLDRTLYVKGFPETAVLDDLEAFFAPTSDQVSAIRMRRFSDSKKFKGSVFVEFASVEEADRVLALALKHDDQALVLKKKAEYLKEKNDERSGSGKKAQANKETRSFIRGCLVKLESVPSDLTYQPIRETLDVHAKVAFVEVKDGAGYARFVEPKAAEVVAALSDGSLAVGEHRIAILPATAEEEKAFYEKMFADLEAANEAARKKRGGRRGNKHAKGAKKPRAANE